MQAERKAQHDLAASETAHKTLPKNPTEKRGLPALTGPRGRLRGIRCRDGVGAGHLLGKDVDCRGEGREGWNSDPSIHVTAGDHGGLPVIQSHWKLR